MAKRQSPEGVRRSGAEGESDVEGHSLRQGPEGLKRQGPEGVRRQGPEGIRRSGGETESDVEGHNFGQNPLISRNTAQARERDVQRNLKAHDLKTEARRPFQKGR